MGVKLRKRGKKWYVVVHVRGQRRAKCVGTSRAVAEKVRRTIEERLAIGELGFFEDEPQADQPGEKPYNLEEYANRFFMQHAELHCKPSTVSGYRQIVRLHLLPRFGSVPLPEITREAVKEFLVEKASCGRYSRNTVRIIMCVLRLILNHAVDDGLLEKNPAVRLGRFAKVERPERQATALTREEVDRFLLATQEICPDYYPLFLTAVRAGLRRGELVALRFGDINFGADETDPNRYILVQNNYVHRRFTSPKSKKPRRVDMSRGLRRVLLALRDQTLLQAYGEGRVSVADDFVFPARLGGVLDPDNLIHYYFLPALAHAGLRKIRFHDLRHTFGSLLIQDGASITYVKEQMGHSSIQLTVDTYGHLVAGANISWVDRLDGPMPPYIPSAAVPTPPTPSTTFRGDHAVAEALKPPN